MYQTPAHVKGIYPILFDHHPVIPFDFLNVPGSDSYHPAHESLEERKS